MDYSKEMKSRKPNTDKQPLPDPHREFLDMDSDEEEFGRQETPETEEELPLEPEKPVFTEEELITLERYVKDLVELTYQGEWTENLKDAIREYFQNPMQAVLSIGYGRQAIIAVLGLPVDCRHFTYFLRFAGQVYTPENFFATIIFGSINGSAENCVLKLMQNIYAPIAIRSDEWPQIKRNDVLANLNGFLMCLTDTVYKTVDLTVLYTPMESFDETRENNTTLMENFLIPERKELYARMERIVRYWTKQIKEALANIPLRSNTADVMDEFLHWNVIYTKLYSLRNQFLSKEIKAIIHRLEYVRSASVRAFQSLVVEVEEELNRATSNLIYLNLLTEHCKDLHIPDDIATSVTQILLLTLFLWVESPFYNRSCDIEAICCALSNQIIRECKQCINLDVAFGDDPEYEVNILERCIQCCETYRKIYKQVMVNIAVHVNPTKVLNINEENIFNRIDTFICRCQDTIEICHGLILFGRCSKVGMLGGAKGVHFEMHCQQIEAIFSESLEEIKRLQHDILDVTKSSWINTMFKYKSISSELENMVKNVIEEIFENVKNVDEGIEAIYGLRGFNHNNSLRKVLWRKWVEVWDIFRKEIESLKDDIMHEMDAHRPEEIANLLNIKKQYIIRQHKIMMNASDWIGDCTVKEYTLTCYKRVMDSLECSEKMS